MEDKNNQLNSSFIIHLEHNGIVESTEDNALKKYLKSEEHSQLLESFSLEQFMNETNSEINEQNESWNSKDIFHHQLQTKSKQNKSKFSKYQQKLVKLGFSRPRLQTMKHISSQTFHNSRLKLTNSRISCKRIKNFVPNTKARVSDIEILNKISFLKIEPKRKEEKKISKLLLNSNTSLNNQFLCRDFGPKNKQKKEKENYFSNSLLSNSNSEQNRDSYMYKDNSTDSILNLIPDDKSKSGSPSPKNKIINVVNEEALIQKVLSKASRNIPLKSKKDQNQDDEKIEDNLNEPQYVKSNSDEINSLIKENHDIQTNYKKQIEIINIAYQKRSNELNDLKLKYNELKSLATTNSKIQENSNCKLKEMPKITLLEIINSLEKKLRKKEIQGHEEYSKNTKLIDSLKKEIQEYKALNENLKSSQESTKFNDEKQKTDLDNLKKKNQELLFENSILSTKIEELQTTIINQNSQESEESKYLLMIESQLIQSKQKLINLMNIVIDKFGEENAADIYISLSKPE